MRNVPQSLTVTLQSGSPLSLHLRRVVGFLSPHFSLVLRDSTHVNKNYTAAHPSCLYRGDSQQRNVHVALSTCASNISAVVVIDSVPHSLELSRRKREAEWGEAGEERLQLEVLTDLTHEAKCGLNQRNLGRLMVSESVPVRLRREARGTRRSKRSGVERVIELGVFVDGEMYNNNRQATEADTIARIQDIVFTYLNAVQLIYQSDKLTSRIRLVVVRLEIMKNQPAALSTSDGNIEAYLENFCRCVTPTEQLLMHHSRYKINRPASRGSSFDLNKLTKLDGKLIRLISTWEGLYRKHSRAQTVQLTI